MTSTEQNDRQQTQTASGVCWKAALRKPAFWLIIVAALAVGFLLRGGSGNAPSGDMAAHSGGDNPMVWTCSMHPQVKLPGPGQCPICFMDLIPLAEDSGDDENPRVLTMSNAAKKLAQIVTAPVERRFADARIQMVGKIDYDETRLAHIAAWVPGRLDSLYADFTGITIKKGDPLVLVYSPELLSAQVELLQAVATARKVAASNLTTIRRTAETTVESARDKLRLWGLTESQIAAIEARGTPSDHITIYAPIGGIVVKKAALEGEYVNTGTPIYTIADLSQVWLELEAYESDLMWLREGQTVEFSTETLPGESFTGTIAFIDPFLDPGTRTVRIRVEVPNPNLRLKPGMFARATVEAETAQQMAHGSIPQSAMEPPLIIPASAPLITGKRAVVYVAVPDRERPTYEGRDVVLGPRAGDYYIVESGLEEGEMVVVNGAFKIDSELQIRARPSMMSPDGAVAPTHDHGAHGAETAESKPKKATPPPRRERITGIPKSYQGELQPVYKAYFDLHAALADDNHDAALNARENLHRQALGVISDDRHDSASAIWNHLEERLTAATKPKSRDDDWDILRRDFESIAAAMIDLDYYFGHPGSVTHYVTLCPMAFNNRGAYWLQNTEQISNPYFGRKMLRCGEVTDEIQADHTH